MKTVRFLSLYCLFILTAAVQANVSRAGEDYSQGMIDRKVALAAADAATTQKFPDADTVTVDNLERVRYQPDGTYVRWEDSWVKILTEKGRQQNTTLETSFTIPYQRGPEDCRFSLAEIIKPDGKVISIDIAKNSQLVVDDIQMYMNIYDPNDKVIYLNVPGLEVGDTLHYVTYDRIVQPRIRDTFCDRYSFESTSHVVHSVVEIQAPESRPLAHTIIKDAVGKTVLAEKPITKEGVITYRWEARDVPRMFYEPLMPHPITVTQRLLVSTAPDWQAISRWYWKLCEPHFAATPEMKAKVAELIKDASDDQQKIRAIFNWVSHEIRYMGITAETEAPGYEPHDVSMTFSRRHGVCRDKAALLAVMLRLAALDAYPVLIHSGPKKDFEVPQPYFNHAITAVRNKDGSYVLMDSTDETTRRLLPSYLSDKSYLVATPEGETLRTSPIVPINENMLRIRTSGRIDASGNIHAQSTLSFDGINDNEYRSMFANMKPDERKRYFEGVLQQVLPGAKLTEIEILPADMQDTSTPLSIQMDFDCRDALVRGGGNLMFPLPLMARSIGSISSVEYGTGLKERKYPLVMDSTSGVREDASFDVDPSLGKLAALPASDNVSDASLLWQERWQQNGNTINACVEFQIKKVELSPKEYKKLKDVLRLIEVDLRKMPIYQASATANQPAAQAENDADVINSITEYKIDDAHSWSETETKEFKILTFAGKQQLSEIHIPFNPEWEDVKLEECTVTSSDGTVHNISPKEINVMDAYPEATPRYPVQKVLAVSFPSVDIGSTVRYRWTRTSRNHPFIAIRESFGALNPTMHKTVRVTAPPNLALVKNEINSGTDAMTTLVTKPVTGERVGWEWTAENMPAIRYEEDAPPVRVFTPTIYVANGEWKSYIAQVSPALLKNTQGQTTATQMAATCTAGLTDDVKRVTAIRDFVAVNIRLAGPGLTDMPLSHISTADVTLAEGYGNSADCAVLLYAMLSAAGYHPEFVLATRSSRVARIAEVEMAHPDYFLCDAVLVRVQIGKDTIYLNDTDQYAALGATEHDGKKCFVLPSGETQQIAASADHGDRSQVSYKISIDDNGDATITKNNFFFGSQFGWWNQRFSQMRPEDKRRYFQQAVAAISQNAEPIGDLSTDFASYPGVVSLSVRAKNFAVRDNDYLYLRLPALSGMLELNSDSRQTPLYIEAPTRGSVSADVVCPSGFEVVRLPESFSREVLGGKVTVSVTQAPAEKNSKLGQRISCVYSAELPAALIIPLAYKDLFNLNNYLSRVGTSMILMRRQPPGDSK